MATESPRHPGAHEARICPPLGRPHTFARGPWPRKAACRTRHGEAGPLEPRGLASPPHPSLASQARLTVPPPARRPCSRLATRRITPAPPTVGGRRPHPTCLVAIRTRTSLPSPHASRKASWPDGKRPAPSRRTRSEAARHHRAALVAGSPMRPCAQCAQCAQSAHPTRCCAATRCPSRPVAPPATSRGPPRRRRAPSPAHEETPPSQSEGGAKGERKGVSVPLWATPCPRPARG